MTNAHKKQNAGWLLVGGLIVVISVLHYTTSTMKWQYHLIYMEAFFVPILIAAFQYGIRGGLGTAIVVSVIYFPHIMLQWGGLIENNLMRFLQIILFNIIGYLTGLKSEAEKREKERYQRTAEELKKSFKKLQQQSERLAESEEQLRLADRLAVVGELTASLAHEVRNPLGSIRGATEIIKDELPEPYRSSEFFQILLDETKRLNEVVENYLQFSQKQKTPSKKYEIQEVVQSVHQMLRYRARKSGMAFEISLPDVPIVLAGNANHLRQILINLILNSIYAMPEGGTIAIYGEVLMQSEICNEENKINKQEIDEQQQPNKKNSIFMLRIKDNGVGIPKQGLEKIFQPFFTTRPDGTGLGLAIVKRLIESNHWQIKVVSEVGQGSEFQILIPLNQQ